MADDRGHPPMPAWPQWCWLPMGTAALVQHHGPGPSAIGDIARVAAVTQWELVGRHIVTPRPTSPAQPCPLPHLPATRAELEGVITCAMAAWDTLTSAPSHIGG
ncbi:hypothetical protein ETD86_10775 [Nonomuraea turkmeniaca]|uniref:Uncharacterized protein n=1 Tax=Nonomuraea turkmeniaca TaxID=103838 RepID=A0A5S4FPH9_9ACTN|nr:hypothetical protein [Nonomuraea turkmeniaca]TMR22613.1 hypothetical protein ETD86_10775 [Nonomuraea turkmeniaca]